VGDRGQPQEVKILFLGASKRVSLLERFYTAAQQLAVPLKLYSCEATEGFYPISHLASVVAGPSFTAMSFQTWLEKKIRQHAIDIIIPALDAATVGLSQYRAGHPEDKCWALVSDHNICRTMHDKFLSDEYFRLAEIARPPNTPGQFPKILKPRFGSASKGLQVVHSEIEMLRYLNERNVDYLVQDFISGARETTVDLYVSKEGKLVGYVLRDRIEVSDGEVMVCRTRSASPAELELIERVAQLAQWQGCITLQYLTSDQRQYVIEINPRFGGGATCGIEAGLDMPLYILSEFLGHSIDPPVLNHKLEMTRARRDFFHEYA
jgi:carbamoyl-phosphate synthase large subunit